MNQANVKVSFYLKKSEADANGECPVMAKLNIGKYSGSGIQREDESAAIPMDFGACVWQECDGKGNQQPAG